MSQIAKEVIALLLATSLAFMILTHSQGFARSVTASGNSFAKIAKTLQGR